MLPRNKCFLQGENNHLCWITEVNMKKCRERQIEKYHPCTVFYHLISQAAYLQELGAKALHRIQRSLPAIEMITAIAMVASNSAQSFLNKTALEENCNHPPSLLFKKGNWSGRLKNAMLYDRNLVP